MIGDSDKLRNIKIFRTKLRVDLQLRKVGIIQQALEVVAQRFAALPESGGHYPRKEFFILGRAGQSGVRHGTHKGGLDLGRRVKSFRRYGEQVFHLQPVLQHDGKPAVFRGRGCGHHALYNLFLQHEMHVHDVADVIQQMEKNGC